MTRRIGFTEQETDEIVRRYVAGESSNVIAGDYAVGRRIITRVLRERGVPRRCAAIGFSDDQKNEIALRYSRGETSAEIAPDFAIAPASILAIVRGQGVPTRRTLWRRDLNHEAFDVLTSGAMYWIGFLFADGHIGKKRISSSGKLKSAGITVNLSAKDREHLEKLKLFLGSSHALSICERGHKAFEGSKGTASLTVYSDSLAGRLMHLGMVAPRTAAPELAMSPDFWRGVVDGDGWLIREKGIVRRIGLCGNRELVEQFKAFVRLHCPYNRANLKRLQSTTKIVSFEVSYNDAYTIADLLYNNDRVALDRKKALAMDMLSRPRPVAKNGHSMTPQAVRHRERRRAARHDASSSELPK
jgi:hypothetical protein